MKRKRMFLLTCFLSIAGLMFAQNRNISGTVISEEDGLPVIGAYVIEAGSTNGTTTDVNGRFTLNTRPGTILHISFLGMETVEVAAQNGMRVTMKNATKDLDEVMVVAYGTAKKSSFTGSAATVDNQKIAARPVSNITKALDSQVAGIQTTSGGGQPGDGASVIIRGFGSINASSTPLYVVDGVPYDGNLAAINPNDIESMTVLKDASAGALYGARGANGVVMITTKKGSINPNVNLKISGGLSSRALKRYNTVSQKDYAQLMYEALRNGYVFDNGYSWEDAGQLARQNMASTLGGEIYNPFKNYTWATLYDENGQVKADAASVYNENWMDAIENKSALRQEYQMSVTGGSDKTQTLLSLGYLSDEGVLKYTDFQRFSGRLNVDNQAKHWFKTGLNASFSHTAQNYSDYDESSLANVWYTAQFLAPIYPVYTKDATGADVLDSNGNRQLDYGISRPQMGNFNCIGTLQDDKFDRKRDNFSGRSYITLGSDEESAGALKGLKLTMNFGADYVSNNQMYYYNMYHGNFASYGGILEKYNRRTFSYTFNQLLTYNRDFDKHNIDVLVGHEFYNYQYNVLYGKKSGLIDGIYELEPATTTQGTGSYQYDYRIESYLSRVNYNYDEKYYASVSYRTDASSRFNKNYRWGNFWSVGANWRISQEDFMQDFEFVNNLALRASYGSQGNDDLGTYYAWQSFYDLTYPNANNAGAIVASLENEKLSWEKNANLNIGLDARLFDRFDIGLEYYNKLTSDLLLNYPMALSTGFTGYDANVGRIRNQGFEFTLGAQLINTPDFKWHATLMGSVLKNKVLELTAEAPELNYGTRVVKEGYEMYTFYMAKSAGVNPANGKQLYLVYEDGAEFFAGDDETPYIVTRDAQGNITDKRVASTYVTEDYSVAATHKWYQGSRIPKLNGAINMNFEFLKNFDFSFNTAYSLGGKIYESNYRGLMEIQYAGNNFSTDVLRRWQKPGDVTDVPRVELNGQYTVNDRFLINASYLSIKNVTLGYTLPRRIAYKLGMAHARVFCTADNLYLFSHLDGMDPQYNFTGGSDYTYTPTKTIACGLDINF